MKAIVCTKYGPPDVLQFKEVEKPAPKDNEVLIKILATTVTAGDCEVRRFEMPILLWLPMRLWMGLWKPRRPILGTEVSGVVESTGSDVTLFREGDEIFGSAGLGFGANAEYRCLPENGEIALKPANMSYEEAVTVPFGGRDSLRLLRKGNIQSGQKILINGAGGSIGTYAVQLAKYFGAEVTAVDSTNKLEMLRSIGADHVIDYTKDDFTKTGEIYDAIFDVVGKISLLQSRGSLKKKGSYLLANPGLIQMVQALWISMVCGRKTIFGATDVKGTEDLGFLKGLVEAGTIKAVIDKQYPLEQIPDAHAYVETGNKKGNVVITVVDSN